MNDQKSISAIKDAGSHDNLVLERICKSYPVRGKRGKIIAQGPVVLDGLSLTVTPGEHLSIIGRSGSGKSTLIRCMNLLEVPESGLIKFGDLEVLSNGVQLRSSRLVEYRRQIGMVFQQFNLFPHLTAVENVALPLMKGAQLDEEGALQRSVEMLRRVGLVAKLASFPHELSGGQQQRVAIARTLALQPQIVLFDEPTSALDPELVGEVLAVMRQLAEEGMTMVIVTHELKFAAEVSSRVIFIDKGEIAEQGLPDQVLRNPINPRTRSFIAQIE